MLTHSHIVDRSMERSLHVEARGWTIVFGTYLDVIVRRYRRWRAERCRCTLASSLRRSRAFDEIAKWGRPWWTIIKWQHKDCENEWGFSKIRKKPSREETLHSEKKKKMKIPVNIFTSKTDIDVKWRDEKHKY